MISYTDIEKANAGIQTLDIKGKDYAIVNERVNAFRKVFPTGRIETEQIYLIGEVGSRTVGFFARVYTEDGRLLGTGHAEEHEKSTFINKTSFIENCETSAVGRALGMAGFGISTSIASAEEVQNAIANQEEPLATEGQINMLLKYYTGFNLTRLLDANNIDDLSKLPRSKASELIGKLKEKRNG